MDKFEKDIIQLVRQYSTLSSRTLEEPLKPVEKEIKSSEFWRSILAEFLATFLFVILLCGSAVPWPGYSPDVVAISLCGGIAIASLVQCFGHISGGHINPAVSLAMFVTKKISLLRLVGYVFAQCAGACTGAAFLYGVTAERYRGTLGATLVADSVSPWQAFGIELILTFCLVFTVFATIDPQRKELGSSSLAIGVVVLVAHLMGISYTGSGINPARSLGPVVIIREWKNHWVYWFGPLIGGMLGGLFYEHLFDPSEKVSGIKEALQETEEDPQSKSQPKNKDSHLRNRPNATQIRQTNDDEINTSNGTPRPRELNATNLGRLHEDQLSMEPTTTNVAAETRF